MKKLGIIVIVVVFLLFGAGLGAAMSYGNDEALPDGFRVGGLNVGGMTPDEAIEKVRTKVNELESTRVGIDPANLGTTVEIPAKTLKELGFQIDAVDAIKAIERHRDYSWWERAKLRYYGTKGESYDVVARWDELKLHLVAEEAWGDLIKESGENASRKIDDRDIVVYTTEKMGKRIELASAIEDIRRLGPTLLTDTESGVRLVKASIDETLPKITVASLKADGLDRKLIEFTTSFATSGQGRSHNVAVAAMALNDTLLMPGEVFEYGKIVAKAEKEYGYMEAPVILKGKLTPGIGGGICQVSSTLYNAALLTGLEIVERRNHSLPVSYLPRGLDATFADGFVNFKFRNSTGKQLLIRTTVEDKTITVKLFGTMDERISYRTETEELKVIPPKTVYVAGEGIALGRQQLLQQGSNGYLVESFLVKMIDGKVVERKKLSKDTYRAQDTLIAVHQDDPRLVPESGKKPMPGAGEGKQPQPPMEGGEIVEPV
ncbi:VanW family protein [Cohnella terricola]|uniref:VanW family protein n=1 Tax=Cohnella terricola TaxID=1289167 RepID=UPI0016494161|nr:VanW family protein [Cohnella terricola]